MFTEKQLGHDCASYFTSFKSVALSTIPPHSKARKNTENFLIFGENNSCRLSKFSQTYIFTKFDHVSGTHN